MKILHCDVCHAEVNDYAHWYNDEKPRNMYELTCVHESNSDTYNGMIICHKCIGKLIDKAESEAKHTDKGCESCKYEDEPEFTSPCVDCSRNHKDMWEAKR